MVWKLENKVIVITGSTKGLGRTLAINMAKCGANLVINYCHDECRALQTLKEICSINQQVLLCRADVSDDVQVRRMYNDVKNRFGKIDVLINNAGVIEDNYICLLSKKRWEKVLNTNLGGTYLCSKYFVRDMISNNSGKIINIASLKGQIGAEGQANYAASKAAIIGLTKSMARELGTWNISVNAVCPGYIMTDLNKGNKFKQEIAEKLSVMNIDGNMKDFVNFVTFLASDAVVSVSGQVFNLDSRIRQ